MRCWKQPRSGSSTIVVIARCQMVLDLCSLSRSLCDLDCVFRCLSQSSARVQYLLPLALVKTKRGSTAAGESQSMNLWSEATLARASSALNGSTQKLYHLPVDHARGCGVEREAQSIFVSMIGSGTFFVETTTPSRRRLNLHQPSLPFSLQNHSLFSFPRSRRLLSA